jgi:hypothetical protein
MQTAQELRNIADRLERFRMFIRRDNGTTSIKHEIASILTNTYGIADPDAVDQLDQFTMKLRTTVANYYMGQFDAAA